MALVPSLLHTETPEKACILLSHLNETVTVSVSLDSLRKNESLFTNLVAEKDLFRCVSFTVSMAVWLNILVSISQGHRDPEFSQDKALRGWQGLQKGMKCCNYE